MLSKNWHIKQLQKIVRKYLKGNSSRSERDFLDSYDQYLDKEVDFLSGVSANQLHEWEEAGFTAIKAELKTNAPAKKIYRYRYAAAAAILLITSGTLVYFLRSKPIAVSNQLVNNNGVLDVLPGSNKATLILADGSKIMLDKTKHDELLKKTGLMVSINNNGELVYKVDERYVGNKGNYHVLETYNGNQFQIVLSDGTKVWLNALSSLRFPETFGNRRVVELKGEGYFEVAKDSSHPFIVKTIEKGIAQEVEVLGTKFNINSYLDEPVIKTTLLEGSIKISNPNNVKILKPNFQAQLDKNQISVKEIEAENEVAWKNGNFSFNNASLGSILEQLERWYNIKVDKGNVPTKRYNGFISRNVNLSEVLNMLSLTGNIQFQLSNDRKLSIKEN